jgi:pSer/pThr/pTyr-binding forkhead associated (FHA) protein
VGAFLTLPDGKQVPVEDGMIIGRSRHASIVLGDKKASRRHARIILLGGVVELEDMGSSNGTLLNGKPVTKRMLRDGDEIRIGTTTIQFHEQIEAPAAKVGGFAGGDDLFGDEPEESDKPVQTVPEPRPKPQPEPQPQPEPEAPTVVVKQPIAPPQKPEPAEVPFEPVVEVRKPKDAEPVSEPDAEDEVLEFADDEVVVVKKTVADLAPRKAKKEAAKAKAMAPDRDGGVLQFSKIEDKRGFAIQDLGQMSGGMRALMILVALAVAAGLFYLAMRIAS